MKESNIGEFIQVLRKEKGLTQKELAEIIGMSDKTISKWENGNSLPDTSMLLPLCRVFDISVNELLSCERITPEDYSVKAEETIMTLIKENENNKRGNKIAGIIGIILLLISVILIFLSTPYGYEGLVIYPLKFINMPVFILLVLLSAGILLVTGVRGKRRVLAMLSKIIIPVGVVIALVSAIVMLTNIENPNTFGPNIHITLLSLVYSFVVKIVVEVMISKSE